MIEVKLVPMDGAESFSAWLEWSNWEFFVYVRGSDYIHNRRFFHSENRRPRTECDFDEEYRFRHHP